MRVTTQILQNQATITPQTLQGLHSLSEINKAFEQASLAPMVEKIVFDLQHIEEIDFSAPHMFLLFHEKSQVREKNLHLINCKREIRTAFQYCMPRYAHLLNVQ